MERIIVGRYAHPETHGWAGWMHPELASGGTFPEWALFVAVDGRVALGVKGGGGLEFASDFGTDHPRTFTREPGDPVS